MIDCGQKILIHQAPAYSTTQTSFEMLGLIPVQADYNDPDAIVKTPRENPDIKGALVQRQPAEDRRSLRVGGGHRPD